MQAISALSFLWNKGSNHTNADINNNGNMQTTGPNKSIQTTYRLQRIDLKKKFSSKVLKKKWLEQAESENEEFSIQTIYGELSSIDLIESGMKISKCTSISVIFGPKIKNIENRNALKKILEQDVENKLRLYSRIDRPEYHAVRIKNNYYYEDRHELNEDYKWATVIMDADDETRKAFDDYWNMLLEKEHRTCDKNNIDKLETYD